MTRLLVSVRDAVEARIALKAGVDLIDVKEPRHGALGAANSATMAAVIETVAGRVPVSLALGELLEPISVDLPHGATYVKIGLAGCAAIADWPARWEYQLSRLRSNEIPVAVVYADSEAAQSPTPSDILYHASRLHCGAVLVDTWSKTIGPLTSHWLYERIQSFVRDVQARDMLAVIAGGLTLDLLPEILAASPDIIAVRGAACTRSRIGEIDHHKVRQLKDQCLLSVRERNLLLRSESRH